MKSNKFLVITTIICILPMILGIVFYNKLPDEVITHWDAEGVADGYSEKNFAVFGMPLIMAGLNILLHFKINNDPKYERMGRMIVLISKLTVPVISVLMISASVIYSIEDYKPAVSVTKIVLILISLLIILMGNYMPKCRQNYTVGIKLPWTLDDEDNWNKTHRLAGYIWMAAGIIMLIFTLLDKVNAYSMIILIVIISAVPAVYSYLLYRNNKIDKK